MTQYVFSLYLDTAIFLGGFFFLFFLDPMNYKDDKLTENLKEHEIYTK